MTTILPLVRRLIVVVVALNVAVGGLLAVLWLTSGDDGAADVATDVESTDVPETTAPPVTEAPDPEPETEVISGAETPDDADPVDEGESDEPDDEELPLLVWSSPPYPDPFEPTANEVQPEAKRLGTLAAYVITNYEVDSTLDDVLAMLPEVEEEFAWQTVSEVDVVHHPGMWSRGTVEYAQLGGHLNGRISIIVVINQEIGLEGVADPVRVEKRVMEVRLARGEGGRDWTLETIATSGGEPAERPDDLSERAAAVVDNDRIDLPDTAKWDIYNGLINEQLLWVMLDMADRNPYKVVVLQTGHSYNVFGTNRVSNHSVGRAVDIYEIETDTGTELVVDAHDPSSGMYALSEWIVSRYDIREFGSPWKFPDAVAHTFTNEVHHDHLHIGVQSYFTSPDPPPTTTAPPESTTTTTVAAEQ